MATSLCSALALAALLQAPPRPPPAPGSAAQAAATPVGDSLLALRTLLARDSADGRAWLLLGRLYLQLAENAHGPPHRALEDSAAVRALLDTSDAALARAGQLLAPSGRGCSWCGWRRGGPSLCCGSRSPLTGRWAADATRMRRPPGW